MCCCPVDGDPLYFLSIYVMDCMGVGAGPFILKMPQIGHTPTTTTMRKIHPLLESGTTHLAGNLFLGHMFLCAFTHFMNFCIFLLIFQHIFMHVNAVFFHVCLHFYLCLCMCMRFLITFMHIYVFLIKFGHGYAYFV